MIKDILELLKYAFSSSNPILSITVVLIIAFLLFITARRFFTTDYIMENKESREQLKQLNDELNKAYERVKVEYEELKKENEHLSERIEQLETENKTLKAIKKN
jgi:uncharacterized membrane protein (DUF106 family)